uniref:Uncharacterized protein n=1 Tax=Oryza sativa subsp. japonica TaxID=39947 RepID=Q6ETR0_ORYSJ|nr:hypothetical protein [Oryza sativa Japonica Group]
MPWECGDAKHLNGIFTLLLTSVLFMTVYIDRNRHNHHWENFETFFTLGAVISVHVLMIFDARIYSTYVRVLSRNDMVKASNGEATEGGGGGDRQIRYALAGSGGVAADGGEGDGDEDGELRRVVGTDGGGDGNSGPDLAAPEADLRPPKGRSGVGQTRGDGVGDNRVNSRRESTSRRQQRHGARGDGGDSDDSRWLAGGNSGWRSRCGCQRRRRHDCGDRCRRSGAANGAITGGMRRLPGGRHRCSGAHALAEVQKAVEHRCINRLPGESLVKVLETSMDSSGDSFVASLPGDAV